MLAVVLDANSIHRDPWLTSKAAARLTDLARDGSCVLIFPEVVVDELRRQQREAAQERHDDTAKLVDGISKAGARVEDTSAQLEETYAKINAAIDASFDRLFARDGVLTEPIPADATRSLVGRDLARRRPFLEVGKDRWSTGFRDAVIWEAVLEVLEPGRGHANVVFVTADAGFLADDSKSLHRDLLDDLDERGIVRDRLTTVKTVWNATSEVEAFVAAEAAAAAAVPAAVAHAAVAAAQADAQARLVTVATDALFALVGEDISMQMVYGGDYDYPDFVKFTVPPIESAEIDDIEQLSEFEFSQNGNIVAATAKAWLSIDGSMFKSDWYMDDGQSADLVGELNDHYFETHSEVIVRAIVEIDVSGRDPAVVGVVLEDHADEPVVELDLGESSSQS